MALENSFRELSGEFQRLQEMLASLQITLGDKPEHSEAALADGFENTVLDVMGEIHTARGAAQRAIRSAGTLMDLDAARRDLTICQARYHLIAEQLTLGLTSYDRLKELSRLGKERGGEWKAWSSSVKDVIDQCQLLLQATSKALARCWQELVEHSGKTAISIQSRNLGQKTVVRSSVPAGLHARTSQS